MDYIIKLKENNSNGIESKRLERCLKYQLELMKIGYSMQNHEKKMQKFWDKESNLERKIFRKFEEWEKRHPLISVFICTVLMGILISLLAGIILEAVYS